MLMRSISPLIVERLCGYPVVCRRSDLVQSGSQTVCDLDGMLECLSPAASRTR